MSPQVRLQCDPNLPCLPFSEVGLFERCGSEFDGQVRWLPCMLSEDKSEHFTLCPEGGYAFDYQKLGDVLHHDELGRGSLTAY
jgi:hypothetical protein